MADFSCPNNGGGSWRSCAGGTRFVGCCTEDPCPYGCLGGHLGPAFFNTSLAGRIPDLECGEGAQFYACASSGFWGCCATDACASAGSCPAANLRPATLVSDPSATAAYSPTGAASSSPAASSSSEPSNASAAIIGGAVGGSAGAILIAIMAYVLVKTRRKNKEKLAAEMVESFGSPPVVDPTGPAELMGRPLRAEAPPNTPPGHSYFAEGGPIYELESDPTEPRVLSELMGTDLNSTAEVEGSTQIDSTISSSA